MSKEFNYIDRVGKAKYVVNYHDGVKTHPDGSKFFDIMIFSNLKKRNNFISDLRKAGYTNNKITKD